MASRYTFKTQVRRDTVCESCGCNYYYIYDVSASATNAGKATENGRKLMQTGASAVPCPRCRKLNANMRRMRLNGLAILVALFALFAWVSWTYAVDLSHGDATGDGTIGSMIGRPLAVVFALVFLAIIIYWPFVPGMNHDGVVPGEEDKAPDKVRAKINAFNRAQQSDPVARAGD